MGQFGIGQPVPREEDPYLLRGRGRYVDDVKSSGAAHGYCLRSPLAHARIRAIDTSKAEAAPGVLLVLTGEHPAVTALGPQVPRMPRKRKDGSPGFIASQPHLARGFVRFVGEAVAFVVAETVDQAKDAAELIEVDYEPLPVDRLDRRGDQARRARRVGRMPRQRRLLSGRGNKAAVDAAIAKADHVIRHRMIINRITANTMEPRGCLAEYDTHDDRYVIRCTVQAPHRTRAAIAASLLKVPETRIRVIADNVGGGFGMKGNIFPEYILAPVAARLARAAGQMDLRALGRPALGRALARQRRRRRTRARQGRQVPGAEGADPRQYRRLSHLGPRRRAAAGQCRLPRRDLYDPAFHVEVLGRDDPHAAHRPLPRRRPARKRLHDRDHDRSRRAQARHRQGRAQAAQHRARRGDAVQDRRSSTRSTAATSRRISSNACTWPTMPGFAARRADARRRGKLRGIGVSNTIEATAARPPRTCRDALRSRPAR